MRCLRLLGFWRVAPLAEQENMRVVSCNPMGFGPGWTSEHFFKAYFPFAMAAMTEAFAKAFRLFACERA